MEFRWAALIALWTMLSGPVFGPTLNPNGTKPKANPRSVGQGKPARKSPDRTPWKYAAPRTSAGKS
jgi:hypothetical protein